MLIIICLIIGLIAAALQNASRYDIDDISNNSPVEVYNLNDYNEYFNYKEISHIDNISDFIFAEIENRRMLAISIYQTYYIGYEDEASYNKVKNEYLLFYNFLDEPVLSEKSEYVLPMTSFELEGFNMHVVKSDYLYDLTIIGFNDQTNYIVELNTLDGFYDHFGKNEEKAKEAFINYVTNAFYLPWFETI